MICPIEKMISHDFILNMKLEIYCSIGNSLTIKKAELMLDPASGFKYKLHPRQCIQHHTVGGYVKLKADNISV